VRKTLNNAVAGVDDVEWHSWRCDGTYERDQGVNLSYPDCCPRFRLPPRA
jgi:hypothetical protein